MFVMLSCLYVAALWVDLLAILYVMFYCVCVTFPCGVLGQVWSFLTLCQVWSFLTLCPLISLQGAILMIACLCHLVS